MSGAERRKHPRLGKDAPLILIQGVAKDGRVGALLRDISLGGLAFETDVKLDPGSNFGFALYVPTRGWVDGTAVVCWAKRSGRGWLCGASMSIEHWDQGKLLRKWLHPSSRGLLKFFFAE